VTVYDSLFDIVGQTPMLRMSVAAGDCILYFKLEKFNPGESIKDRAAQNMILQAERRGDLRKGSIIIESSSGNTGISLAMLAAERGYTFICVVDNHVSPEKVDILRAYGAVIERVGEDLPPDYHAAAERIARVKQLLDEIPGAFFIDQGDNPDNSAAHYYGTAEEILSDVGAPDYLIASVGTGGSISGTGKRLKEVKPTCTTIAVEPAGSVIFGEPYAPFFQSGSGSARMIFKNVDFSIIDEHYQVGDQQAFTTCRYMARHHGLLLGGSGGSVVYKAVDYIATHNCHGVVVALIPDGGARYLSTIFNDHWISDHNLFDSDTWDYLQKHLVTR